MDFATFARAAERGQLPPVLIVHGDAQIVSDALALVTSSLFPDPGLVSLGREVLDGDEATATDVVRSAMTLPLMTAIRLVAVRRAQELDPEPMFAEYVRDPNPATCLLLLSDESLDARRESGREKKRHWLLDAIPAASVVTMPALREGALADWLRQRAAQEGIQVSAAAAKMLVDWVGDDTATLVAETRKAALAGTGAPGTVGEKDVTAIVGEHKMAEVFDLTGAVARHDPGAALRTLDRLLGQEEPMRLLALLTTEIRFGWRIKELDESGQSPEQIARSLYRPPPVVKHWLAKAQRTPVERFATWLRRCWEVEKRLKSGGEARAELAALVTELSAEAG